MKRSCPDSPDEYRKFQDGDKVSLHMPFMFKFFGTLEFYIRTKKWEWPTETWGVIRSYQEWDDMYVVAIEDLTYAEALYIVHPEHLRKINNET